MGTAGALRQVVSGISCVLQVEQLEQAGAVAPCRLPAAAVSTAELDTAPSAAVGRADPARWGWKPVAISKESGFSSGGAVGGGSSSGWGDLCAGSGPEWSPR